MFDLRAAIEDYLIAGQVKGSATSGYHGHGGGAGGPGNPGGSRPRSAGGEQPMGASPLSFESEEKADQWLASTLELNPELTEDQDDALRAYKGDQFLDVNDQLRMSGGYSTERTQKGVDIQETMDEVFAKAPGLPQAVRVYRGIGTRFYGDDDDLTGMETQDRAYVSTTLRRKVAEGFSEGIVIEIRVPAGVKALNFERWKSSKRVSESELLLPRESRFRVISDTGVDDEDRQMIWELIP